MERRQAARGRGDYRKVAGAVTEAKGFFTTVSSSQPLEGHHLDGASGPRLTVPRQLRGPDGSMGSGAEGRLHRQVSVTNHIHKACR